MTASETTWQRFRSHPGFWPTAYCALSLFVVLALVLGMAVGTISLTPGEVVHSIFGPEDYQ